MPPPPSCHGGVRVTAVTGRPERQARMTASSWSSLASRLTPAHLTALALVLGSTVFALGPPSDPDVWWHLRSGAWILDHHRLPGVDQWSLVARGRPWLSHEWLGEVTITAFYRTLGLHGISVFRALAVLALLLSLTVQVFRRTSPYRALAVVVLAVFATSGGWGERPQLLSFLLLIPAAQLGRAAVAGRRSAWWFVPLTWLWANVHGEWFLTVVLLGAAVLGVLWERGWVAGRDQAARLTTVATISLAAAALTPNGPRLLLEPFRISQSAHFVSEWDPPTLHSTYGLAFFLLLGTLLVILSQRRTPVDRHTLVQLLVGCAIGLSYTRTLAPGTVLLAPLIAGLWQPPQHREPIPGPARLNTALVGLVGLISLIGATLTLTELPALPPGAPVQATTALLRAAPAPQRVLNDYNVGGWLLGRAPSALPAIDGRIEIYPLGYVGRYFDALAMRGDWRQTIVPLHANVALLYATTPLVNGLLDELHWRTVYRDDTWVVLVPPSAGIT